MAITADVIEFTRDDTALLLVKMSEFTASGNGWINIGPGLTPEEFGELPARSAVAKWLSGRGPAVPMATWTPRSKKGRGARSQIGVAHGTGPNAIDRLVEAGVDLPPGWLKQQDHAKNGIVVELPDSAADVDVVEWLIRAMIALSPRVEVSDDWIAEAYGGN